MILINDKDIYLKLKRFDKNCLIKVEELLYKVFFNSLAKALEIIY